MTNNILKYTNKPSGVYTEIIDNSQINNNQTLFNQIPLVIGFSKKGPFNKAIFIESKERFINVYGKIDRQLEKNKSFFHRSALELLNETPIMCLNLYNINMETIDDINTLSYNDETYDLVEVLNLSSSISGDKSEISITPYSSVFDRSKYWEPSTVKLKESSLNNTLFSVTNLGQTPVSILVTKNTSLTNYDIPVSSWYDDIDDIPEYLHEDDYINDFMIDFYVIKGDFSDYKKLSTHKHFSTFFNENGLIQSKLNEFINYKYTNVLNIYSGSLIPEFIDKDGRNLDIEQIVNSDYQNSNILINVNEDLLETMNVDLVGHNIFALTKNNTSSIDFLSYNKNLVDYNAFPLERLTLKNTLLITPTTITLPLPKNSNNIQLANIYDAVKNSIVDINSEILVQLKDGTNVEEEHILTVSNVLFDYTTEQYTLVFNMLPQSSSLDLSTTQVDENAIVKVISNFDKTEVKNKFVNNNGSLSLVLTENETGNLKDLYDFAYSGSLIDGDKILVDLINDVSPFITADGVMLDVYSSTYDETSKEITIEFKTFDFLANGFNNPNVVTINLTGPTVFKLMTITNVLTANDLPYFEIDCTEKLSNVVNVSSLALTVNNRNIKIGDYIVSMYDNTKSRVSKIRQVTKLNDDTWDIESEDTIYVEGNQCFILKNENDYNLSLFTLHGFTMKDRLIPNDTDTRINEIYDVLYNTNIGKTLADKKRIQFRYIVDTFNGGIQLNSKYQLTKLAESRGDCLAICNIPTIKEFEDSTNPSFTDISYNNTVPEFNLTHLTTGGNLEKNPTNRFTLPSIENGATYGAFFGPNVLIRERNKTLSVPPSMFVAKLLIRKHFDYRIWDAMAGDRRGKMYGNSVVGLEYYMDNDEIPYFTQIGINPLIYDQQVGIMLKSDLTAKQSPKSSLSSLSSVETLIYIQKRLETILRTYLWETNNTQNRLEIKTLVENELKQLIIDDAIYNASVQMNELNNTNEIIDNLLGVIDVSIELSKKFKSIINRITIYNTGEISVGLLN